MVHAYVGSAPSQMSSQCCMQNYMFRAVRQCIFFPLDFRIECGEKHLQASIQFCAEFICELCKGSCDTKFIHHWPHSIENSVYSFLSAVFCFKMSLRVLNHRLYHVFANLTEVGDYQGSAAISNLTRVRRQVLWTDLAGVYLAM